MLDGILGRGFSAKCKSLMKGTRARIEVVRRRAEAKQRLLNEDLAKLLSNGLDINAFGRTEEFLAGMNLLWSYDFVLQSCEYIIKQLLRMEKQGECPEECKEAVASLMYAAARLSDLPELRDLRDMFQQRFGDCLAAFVNQKLVEKLSSRPPPKEKRLQVLQDIASEFSIKWDARGFERRMAAPSVVAQVDEQKVDIVKQNPGLLDEKRRTQSYGEGNISKRDERDHHISRKDMIAYRERSLMKSGGSSKLGNDDLIHRGRSVFTESKHSNPIKKTDEELNIERSDILSHGKTLDSNVHNGYARHGNGIHNPRKGEKTEGSSRERATAIVAPSCVEQLGKTDCSNQDNALNSTKKRLDEGLDVLKSCSGYAPPPPYVKPNHNFSRPPYVKPKGDKHKLGRDPKHAVPNLVEHFTDPGSVGQPLKKSYHDDCEEQFAAPARLKNCGHEKELDYLNEKIPLPKPRSIRRKHHKSSSSSHNVVDALEDVEAENRSSSSRRKDHSRKGLQILFDEEHHRKDDEERMIDKLLIHYSKKPLSYDSGKVREKLREGESSLDHQSRNVHDGKQEVIPPPPTRSVSLPHEQVPSQELKKVFGRSNTFQADNKARHVHPKLPDYDDLAAMFAALKGR